MQGRQTMRVAKCIQGLGQRRSGAGRDEGECDLKSVTFSDANGLSIERLPRALHHLDVRPLHWTQRRGRLRSLDGLYSVDQLLQGMPQPLIGIRRMSRDGNGPWGRS